jgi:hypothetical protein
MNMVVSRKQGLAKFAFFTNGLLCIVTFPYVLMGISLYWFPIFGFVLLALYWLEMQRPTRHSSLIWTATLVYNVGLSLFYASKLQDPEWILCLVWTVAMFLLSVLALFSSEKQ